MTNFFNLGKPPASRRKSSSEPESIMLSLMTKLFRLSSLKRRAKEEAEMDSRDRMNISMSSTAENVEITSKKRFPDLGLGDILNLNLKPPGSRSIRFPINLKCTQVCQTFQFVENAMYWSSSPEDLQMSELPKFRIADRNGGGMWLDRGG